MRAAASGAHARLEQLDLVGGELGGVRPADVAVLVVADQRVDAAGVAQRQHHQLVDHLVGGVAVVLAEEVGPVALVEVRAVDQIAGEQQVGVAGRGVDLVEQLDDRGGSRAGSPAGRCRPGAGRGPAAVAREP
jgi:hypothetical protein